MTSLRNTKRSSHIVILVSIINFILPLTTFGLMEISKSNCYITEPSTTTSKTRAIEVSDDDFEQLQQKWRQQLVPQHNDLSKFLVRALSADAKDILTKLYNEKHVNYHLSEVPSANLTYEFANLLTLTTAYVTKGTAFFKSIYVKQIILDGLEEVQTSKLYKYDGINYRGNWWHYQIGAPQKFIDILMILITEIPEDIIRNYTEIINKYVPDSYHQLYAIPENKFVGVDGYFIQGWKAKSANMLDLAQTVLGLGVLQKDVGKIKQAVNTITEVFKIVTKGDGFYNDGSFIQHAYIPYTGAYGVELLTRLTKILAIIKDTKFELAPDIFQNIAEAIEKAYIPLIYNGEMLHMVAGRSISRPIGYKCMITYNLLAIAETLPDYYQNSFKEALKYWIHKNPKYYVNQVRNMNDLILVRALINNNTIIGDKLPFNGTKMYASMDRFVQHTLNYTIGISMYSKRVASFEAGNGEHQRGWHTADGMLYLYNDDGVQFSPAYWATVDPYRLPGTTVDTVLLQDELINFSVQLSQESWVGGVCNENQAAIGMSLNKIGTKNNNKPTSMNLRAKKSWFVVDGQVIALGAGIKGETEASIETIVENRLLNENHTYNLLSNRGFIKNDITENGYKWLLLQSSRKNNNIGYYFPNETPLNIVTAIRNGSHKEINTQFSSDKMYTGKYQQIIIKHGSNVKNGNYSYVILPGITYKDLINYAKSPPAAILSNTVDMQAVIIKNANYLGINIWNIEGGTLGGFSCNKPVSLIRNTNNGISRYILTDPRQMNITMSVKLPLFSKIVSMSEGVSHNNVTGNFIVNFVNARGSSQEIVVLV